ncbi:MAG: hypothetical protein AMXMBFR7_36920 [Planctomycetota bacterium]
MPESPETKPPEAADETIADVLLKLAQAGDLSKVAQTLSGRGVLAYEPQDHQKIIRRCIAACAQAGTPQLADALLQSMLAFDGALLLRAQTRALFQMKRADAESGPTVGPLPKEAVEELERVGRLEERIVFLAQNYSRVQRSLGLPGCGGKRKGSGQVLRMGDYLDDNEVPAKGGE